MSEHTKGRLAANYLGGIFGGAANGLVAQVSKTANPSVCAADARRLVACWNALEGVSTDAVEGVVDRVAPINYGQLERDRAELITALRNIIQLDDDPHPGLATWCQMRARAGNDARTLIAKHAEI